MAEAMRVAADLGEGKRFRVYEQGLICYIYYKKPFKVNENDKFFIIRIQHTL